MDRVLKRCETTQLDTFRLKLSNNDIQRQTVSRWISEAVRLNVCELDIDVKVLHQLPLSIFACKTLTKFRLHVDLNQIYWEKLEGSTSFNLPCLKTLDIVAHSSYGMERVFKVIHACPSLETLYLILYMGDRYRVYNFKIPSLRRLKLKFIRSYSVPYSTNKVVLNVPNLEYLSVDGDPCSVFVMENLASLIEAKVSGEISCSNNLLDAFLEGISGVKSLHLSFTYQYRADCPVVKVPKFPNLKYLTLNGDGVAAWNLIHKFLESSSQLEHLSIGKVNGCHWNEPKPVPTCMLTNLKTMEYDLNTARKCDINFLRFMLGNSKVLTKLTVTCRAMKSLKENQRLCARLSGFPKASRDCQLHFI